VELGKFFPAKSGIKIPAYVNISNSVATPQYDPQSPDVELKKSLAAAPTSQAGFYKKCIGRLYHA
jgi:cell surface protein SprA